MYNANNQSFYSDLILQVNSVSDVVGAKELFRSIPEDWVIINTDIQNSTNAILGGEHQTVNLISTGSIIAVLNIAYSQSIEVPFFFGGDGATLIIPPSILDDSLNALYLHQSNTFRNFDLYLRVGSISVSDIYKKGLQLKIAKVRIHDFFSIPIILGNGLIEAEKHIKERETIPELLVEEEDLNLEGMECRWDVVNPPKEQNEVLCLLVTATTESKQSSSYKKVLEIINDIYGSLSERNPISVDKLNLTSKWSRVNLEMKVKSSGNKFNSLMKRLFAGAVGNYYITKKEEGKNYIKSIIDLTDTLVMDGKINTVISGSLRQSEKLIQELDEMEKEGFINYGIHKNTKSVMSCYVRDRKHKHIHFVDGSDGGYTMAAKVLKQKLK